MTDRGSWHAVRSAATGIPSGRRRLACRPGRGGRHAVQAVAVCPALDAEP